MTEPAERHEASSSDRRSRRAGVGWLLASLPFAAAAVYFQVSCGGAYLGVGGTWDYFAFYVAPLLWFVATCFGLYRLNLFAIRRDIWNLVSAAIVATAVGAALGFAAFWIGFSRCFTF